MTKQTQKTEKTKNWKRLTGLTLIFLFIWLGAGCGPGADNKSPQLDQELSEDSAKTEAGDQTGADLDPAAPDPDPDPDPDPSYSPKQLSYEVEVLAEGLDIPWEILALGEGRFLITERPGRVLLLDQDKSQEIQGVQHIGEGGLLGIEKSPDFAENKHIFLYYTYTSQQGLANRLSRFTLQESRLIGEETILEGIPGAKFHNGGRIKFGPDDKLYITTGDARQPDLAQDIDSLAGKILRINTDGSLPEDNPFEDSPVYALGLRNPQGLAWHPTSQKLYASDHGPERQDEINLILPGQNYGWPQVTCKESDSRYQDPLACYADFTLAPSGMAFLPWDNLDPVPLYLAGLRGQMIRRLDIDDQAGLLGEEAVFTDFGRMRTLLYHEGSLYASTNNRDGRGNPSKEDDQILKITPHLDKDPKEVSF